MIKNISYQHESYESMLPEWTLVDDVCAGERKIKAQGDKYLPRPNPMDKTEENAARYAQYLARAVFYGATWRTLVGLIGAAFRKPPEIEIPGSLEYIKTDADGQGVSIYQQAQNSLASVLKKGRHGLWVDYPVVEGGASKAQLDNGSVQANIIGVKADSITNWRVEKVGAKRRLVLLVMRETVEEPGDDGFSTGCVEQYRALRLIEGAYVIEVWRKGKDTWQLFGDPVTPRRGNGQAWTEIPFTFVGAQDNNPDVDLAPLYDMAVLNVAHYRNSADYEDSAYFCGQPQPWISGLDDQWRDWLVQQGIYVGARAPLLLPENGAFGFAQAEPNTLCKEAMSHKEAQMIALGARLVQKGEQIKTATEAQADNESEHSALSLAAENVSSAYRAALTWAGEFMNATGTIDFAINNEFSAYSIDAQQITALVDAHMKDTLPISDLWAAFRKGGIMDPERSDEDTQGEIDANPAGLNLDQG